MNEASETCLNISCAFLSREKVSLLSMRETE